MPALFQSGSYAIPVSYYGIILRGVFLKGSGLAWLTFASARFRKRLD